MNFKYLSPLLILFFLSGCSTVQTHQVESKKGFEIYQLSDFYNEPPSTFKSSALSAKAKNLCPLGYEVLDRNVVTMGEFKYNAFQCASKDNCAYKLQWKIKCTKKVQKGFSLFGKF